MKPCLRMVLLISITVLASCTTGSATAQTLKERLIAEDASDLAEVARKNGNIVRGAILFHQGNINCAKCHRPQAESDRMGPDLSRMDEKFTDAFVVESILQPSKAIKEGFETITVSTLDGQVHNGIVVKNNDVQIVLRDREDVDRLITIRREDLDETKPNSKSSMPDNLVDELKNRQQFLDLVRFVLDVRDRGPDNESNVANPVTRRELSPELNGLVLIQDLNCVACHQSPSAKTIVAAKKSPRLKWSASRLHPEYIARFISDPQSVKPGSTMPHMLGQLNRTERNESAMAITHYLVNTVANKFQSQPASAEAVVRGGKLFHAVGCVACHAPRDELAREIEMEDSTPLGDLAAKYDLDGLVMFLEDPHAVRESGRMPNMGLAHQEARDIANYLLQTSTGPASAFDVDSALAGRGEELFSKFSCSACHTEFLQDQPAGPSRVAFAELRPERGCLSGEPGNWPEFHLTEQDRKWIQAAIKNYPTQLDDEEQIAVSLRAFNCIACHDRNDFGGVTPTRNPHFQTTNLNLGDQGRIPPTLTGVGAKLKSKWMRDVLVNGRTIRPYMKTRMPQFGEQNIGHLISLFEKTDKLPATQFATFDDQKEMRKQGLEMAGNKGLNCVACHTYKYKLSDTMPAVDLTEMSERLKKDWFHQYMLAPQRFSPNTVMPSFWPGGVAIRSDIAGDPAFQVEALWQYLIDGRQAGTPSGVVREPLEIVVTDETRMLRRNYPGIGKRGIGVGYPGGTNLAFDAEQMRLAMIWKGKFVDPGGVWTGQGSGNVRPLNRPINLAKGPELDDAANPWVVDDGRPPNHQFKGYLLDKLRRPTFMYRFENVEVKDFFLSVVGDQEKSTRLRRNVTLSSAIGRKGLNFRVASGQDISREDEDWFTIDGQLKIRIVSDHAAEIIDVDNEKQLRIPLDIKAGDEEVLIIEYLWK